MVKDLKEFYENIYKKDSHKFFVAYRNNRKLKESHIKVIEILESMNKNFGNFLDFGCGQGEFIGEIAKKNIKCIGIDFSPTAIKNARELNKNLGIQFIEGSFEDIEDKYDCITSFGTLEHLEDPEDGFKALYEALKPGGVLIITCPNFSNIRGLIWMTLSKLFNVPMSLSDKHFLSPKDIKRFLRFCDNDFCDNVSLDIYTVDNALSMGDDLFQDMKKRLSNALRDAKMNYDKVDDLLEWVKQNQEYFSIGKYSGATAIYVIQKTTKRRCE